MSDTDRIQRLNDFVAWSDQHITGDEKGEAQLFLDRFFKAFGHDGLLEAGGTAEFRIRKAKEDGGGTAFADCVWKPHVLIEMKKRGQDLAKYFRQAFDYWQRLAPGRPHYVILCNFDELWVYDFDSAQFDVPMDKVAVDDLPERFGPLRFLFPTHEEPVFGNDNEKVTREAARKLAVLFNKLKIRQDVGRETAQRFVLQLLVALFAEDIGLLDAYTIESLVADCNKPADAYDLFGGLFEAMNEQEVRTGGRYKGIKYFNGGLFANPAKVELAEDELAQINEAAKEDWSKVRPEIFGTIFEQTMETGDAGGADERHAYGAHFTAAQDIMKIIEPTMTAPWEKLIDKATTVKRLRDLHQRMQNYRVLDPACGSGNFLYLAYRELKRLEKKLIDKLIEVSKKQTAGQMQFSFVTTRQFFGMDINPFAVELGKVTMMLAHKLAIDELHIDEPPLPLDNLEDNFRCCDALITPADSPWAPPPIADPPEHNGQVRTDWPEADVIIGNPPFLGAKRLKPERGADYVNTVRKLYPDVPGMADYCVYWFRRSHDELPVCTKDDPVAGRAGLVGTQNIRNNKSREGGLDYIVKTGTVVEAVDNQPWSGEANVHVSIANWVKTGEEKAKPADLLLPAKKKLWYKLDTKPQGRRKRGQGSASKQYELGSRETEHINAALSDQVSVSIAKPLICNKKPQVCFQGVVLGYNGFAVTHKKRKELIAADSNNSKVVRPWLIGRDLLTGDGKPSRCVIDFADRDMFDARSYELPFEILEQDVLPEVRKKAEKAKGGSMEDAREEHLNRWWQFWNVRSSMREAYANLGRFIGVSRTTMRPIFVFISTEICPDSKVQTFAINDDYSFAVLSANEHWEWFSAKAARLKNQADRSYSSRSVWDTFPWPQSPSDKDVDAAAEAGRRVRAVRDEALKQIKGGLRALYRTLELPGKNPLKEAHAALDEAVMKCYCFSKKKDLLQQLLELNLDVAEREQRGEPVTAPGIPATYRGERDALVTEDCIRPA